jgi:integrase
MSNWITYCTGEQFEKPLLYLYIRLALGTGGRYCEILRLKWNQVNFKKHTITFTDTKGKEDRSVPVDSDTLGLLQEHYELSISATAPVFPIKGVVHPWYRAREKAGLP